MLRAGEGEDEEEGGLRFFKTPEVFFQRFVGWMGLPALVALSVSGNLGITREGLWPARPGYYVEVHGGFTVHG